MDENEERRPLMAPSTSSTVPPPAYSTVTHHDSEPLIINEFDASELPPPYMPSGHGSIPMINCKVCQAMISLEGKTSQHVVKCGSCNEATAIRPAPAGKKYVRCKCNCLLICKTSSRRVVCPRQTCKRLIILGLPANEVTSLPDPNTLRIICVHCQQTFFFGIYSKALARCPHCRRVSTVGRSFARNRGLMYFIPGILLLIAGIVVIGVTQAHNYSSGGIYAAYVVILVAALILLLRASYYFSIKVSHVEGAI